MTAHRLLVTGAGGGLGATCLSCALGLRAARRGLRTVVVEARRGGLDVVCGIDGWPGLRLDDLADLDGALTRADAERLLERLPRAGGDKGPVVLSHAADGASPTVPRPAGTARRGSPTPARAGSPAPEAFSALLTALADLVDLLVIDAAGSPPGDLPGPADDVLLLVGADPHRLALAAATPLDEHSAGPVRLVLAGTGVDDDLALAAAELLGADEGHALGHDPHLGRDLVAAAAPGSRRRSPLARTADRLLDACTLQTPTRTSRRVTG